MRHGYLGCPTSNSSMRYTGTLSVGPAPNVLLRTAGCPTPNALIRIAECPTPNALLRIAWCPTPNVLLRISVCYAV